MVGRGLVGNGRTESLALRGEGEGLCVGVGVSIVLGWKLSPGSEEVL